MVLNFLVGWSILDPRIFYAARLRLLTTVILVDGELGRFSFRVFNLQFRGVLGCFDRRLSHHLKCAFDWLLFNCLLRLWRPSFRQLMISMGEEAPIPVFTSPLFSEVLAAFILFTHRTCSGWGRDWGGRGLSLYNRSHWYRERLDFGLSWLLIGRRGSFDNILLLDAVVWVEMGTVVVVLIFSLPSSVSVVVLVVWLLESVLLSLVVGLIESLIVAVSALLRRVELIAASLTLILVVILVSRRLEVALALWVLLGLILVVVLGKPSVARWARVRVATLAWVDWALDQPTANSWRRVVLKFFFRGPRIELIWAHNS